MEDFHFGTVEMGFSGVKGLKRDKGALILGNSKIIFKGSARFGSGSVIRADNGVITFGKNFSCSNGCFYSCSQALSFGDNVLVGWNVNIRDADGHTLYHDCKKVSSIKPVCIGNHVWIAANVDILKGVSIPDGCVVAYRSCLTKPIDIEKCLVAGYPAKIIRNNIEWRI